MRVSRNDPCPCGSGNKYKKCCLSAADLNSIDSRSRDNFFNKVQHRFGDKIKMVCKGYGSQGSSSKISSLILDMVEDIFDADVPFEDKESVIGLAIIAWNAAIIGKAAIPKAIAAFMEGVDTQEPEDEQMITDMITDLVRRKNIMFPEVKNLIFAFEITNKGDDFNLQVAYYENVA